MRAGRESKHNTTAPGGVLIAIQKDLKDYPVTLPTKIKISTAAAALIKVDYKTTSIACINNPPGKSTYRLPIKDVILFFKSIITRKPIAFL